MLTIPEQLTQDCDNCQGLCCMAHVHRPQDGFPISERKPAGAPCFNLETDSHSERGLYKCRIYGTLADSGWTMCEQFTCYGAGQAVSKFFKELGISWAEKPEEMIAEERRIRILNFRYGYQALFEVFKLLHAIKVEIGEEAYLAAKTAVAEASNDFCKAMQRTDCDLDPNYWVRNHFDLKIRAAILPIYERLQQPVKEVQTSVDPITDVQEGLGARIRLRVINAFSSMFRSKN